MAVAHRVYAEALLEAADENGRLDKVREDFEDFAAAVEESHELRRFLQNPQIEPRTKRAAIEDLLADSDPFFLNFVRLLADKNRIGELDRVYEEWTRLLA